MARYCAACRHDLWRRVQPELDSVTWPSGHRHDLVATSTLPNSLQTLAFGYEFAQLEGVTLPSSLQT